MNLESKLLIDALGIAVAGKTVQLNTAVDQQAFLALTASHNVSGLVYVGTQGAELLPQVQNALMGAYHKAIFRDTQQAYIRQQLEEALTREQIPHVFLKGAQLKENYPISALRTMSDMDVLVHTEDYEKLDAISASLGATPREGDGNHRNFQFPGGVMVEFHPNIVHHGSRVAAVNPGWQYVKDGKLSEEGLYLTVLCHLADHFMGGGIGVRFVLDVWVIRNLRGGVMDRSFLEAELTRFGILEFVKNIEALAEAWFGNGQLTPLLESLGEYILTSGSHGFEDRAVLNSVTLAGSKTGALWKKIFYPRQELEDRFPWAKGKPWLLPAAWCTRAFRAVTRRGALVTQWSQETAAVTREQIRDQQQLLKSFGIK